MKSVKEIVNHPKHYNEHPSGIECITIVEWFNFNIGNALKYLWRAGLKNNLVDDLKKALWYVQREIERITNEKAIRKTAYSGPRIYLTRYTMDTLD